MPKQQAAVVEQPFNNPHDFFFRLFVEKIKAFAILVGKLSLPPAVSQRCHWNSLTLTSPSLYDGTRETRVDALMVVDYQREDGKATHATRG